MLKLFEKDVEDQVPAQDDAEGEGEWVRIFRTVVRRIKRA